MNRWDQIQCAARDIASNVHDDPTARNLMADQLISLCGLMIEAVGKSVAGSGESSLNEAMGGVFFLDTESIDYSAEEMDTARAEFESEQHDEALKAHAQYLTGERVQDGARLAVSESLSEKCDVERYERTTPGTPCQCGHVPKVHTNGGCIGEQYNRESCSDGPCTGFTVQKLDPIWVHVDRRPPALQVQVCNSCGHHVTAHDEGVGCLFQNQSNTYCDCNEVR